MDTTTKPTAPTPLSDRMEAVDFDGRARELPEHLRNAAISEELLNEACAWLEAHPPAHPTPIRDALDAGSDLRDVFGKRLDGLVTDVAAQYALSTDEFRAGHATHAIELDRFVKALSPADRAAYEERIDLQRRPYPISVRQTRNPEMTCSNCGRRLEGAPAVVVGEREGWSDLGDASVVYCASCVASALASMAVQAVAVVIGPD